MHLAYDLRQDHQRVKAVQSATLSTEKYGIVSDDGLFGSNEWWQAVESGALAIRQIVGTISRVYMAGHNDFPMFEVHDGNTKTQWERFGAENQYIERQRIIMEIVETRSRFSGELRPTVIRIWLGT